MLRFIKYIRSLISLRRRRHRQTIYPIFIFTEDAERRPRRDADEVECPEEDDVQRVVLLVTPDGQWVLPDGAEFFEALGDPDPDYDAVGFAVRNLGFIRFQMFEHSMIEVELHPRNVGLPALLSVQQEIMKSEVRLFRIKF